MAGMKQAVLRGAKALGLFALARRLMRGKIRILCYHGFTLKDEHRFIPGLFIAPEEFERRLDYLERAGYAVLPLDEACERLKAGTLPADPIVLTIDDGFYSVYAAAMPILKRHGFPATLYLTSYYFEKGSPLFNLVIDYLFWKTRLVRADFSSLGVPGLPDGVAEFPDVPAKDRIAEKVMAYGKTLDGDDKRAALARKFGEILGVSYDDVAAERVLSLVNSGELTGLRDSGIDIELHTHRHDFPEDAARAADAIARNRQSVEPHLPAPMRHFCYPSGVWSHAHWPVLEAARIETATTCEPGLVDAATPVYGMPRILDSARVSQIEFEAEMSGFIELKRRLLGGGAKADYPGAQPQSAAQMIG
jgi:peptidoglycan/xylan/chitin deacetylase (PgdA/CDA1 family)